MPAKRNSSNAGMSSMNDKEGIDEHSVKARMRIDRALDIAAAIGIRSAPVSRIGLLLARLGLYQLLDRIHDHSFVTLSQLWVR